MIRYSDVLRFGSEFSIDEATHRELSKQVHSTNFVFIPSAGI
jgi:hypothetical protein